MAKKSTVNKAGNYTKPGMRKRIFNRIKAGSKGGRPGQWSARKAQMVAKAYKAAGGGYLSAVKRILEEEDSNPNVVCVRDHPNSQIVSCVFDPMHAFISFDACLTVRFGTLLVVLANDER